MNSCQHTILLISLLSCLTFQYAAGQNTFYKTIGHQTEGSEGRNVAQAADGGYFLSYYIYYASDYITCVAKFNCAGIKEWEHFYNGGMVTLPLQLIPQIDKGCLISFSEQNLSGVWQHVVTRIDAAGNSMWTRRLNMHAGNLTGGMVQDQDGSVYLCGSVLITATGFHGTAITKLSATGQVLWERHYGEGADHTPRGITVAKNGVVTVMGQVGIPTFIFTNIFIFNVDKNGSFLKRKVVTTTYDDEALAVCSDDAGNIYIAGYSYFLATAWDVMFLKLDGQLNVIQSKFYDSGTAQGEHARYIIPAGSNAFALFGDEGGFNERNPMMMKLDADGNLLWAKHYTLSPQYTNYFFHGAVCSDGGFLMTGDARPASQFRVAPFIKTDANGNMGCYTSSISFSVRSESLIQVDTSLHEFLVAGVADTSGIPYAISGLPTSNTSFCQNLLPCGKFYVATETLCPEQCYKFTQNSFLANSWSWYFENGTPAESLNEQPPVVCYDTPGPHMVELTLTNAIGSVTYSQTVNPDIDCPIVIPNIFTPGSDGLNDEFKVDNLQGEFTLKIYNRWGQEIFASGFPGIWWNGDTREGKPSPDGVYFYFLYVKALDKKYHGTLQLLRN